MITGASSGIGRGLALALGRQGAKLGLVARRADALRELVEEIKSLGSEALSLPADVQDAASVRAAADQLRAEFQHIDLLIANAGIGITSDAA